MTENNEKAGTTPEVQVENTEGKEVAGQVQERDIKKRVLGAVADEVARLNEAAEDFRDRGNHEAYCHAVESIASIKARAEVFCIQVEMAATTAAMATLFGNAMRNVGSAAPGAVPGAAPGDLPPGIAELIRRGRRPGIGAPVPPGPPGSAPAGKSPGEPKE
ncbi:MAG: hypothetical protein ABFD77_04285 [Thermotogota bacterium]